MESVKTGAIASCIGSKLIYWSKYQQSYLLEGGYMALDWTDDLSTGSHEIDRQHKELFKRINALLEACRQGKGRAEVNKVVQFLDDYVVTHFSEEENYMQKYHYPNYAHHKAQHLEFMETFAELRRQIKHEGAGVHLLVKTNHMIVQWLVNHICKVDRALGTFLKTKV
jgi:hemerythrin